MEVHLSNIIKLQIFAFMICFVALITGCPNLDDNVEPHSSQCTNGICEDGEDCHNCEQDCGPCEEPQPVCSDGDCNGNEDCSNCEQDCGPCEDPQPTCSDGECNGDEDCSSCEQDCGACEDPEPTCPDGACNGDEDCSTCEQDCGVCEDPEPICPDGECNGSENCSNCEQDCGPCQNRKPNIVFIFADDLGYGDLTSYGHPYSRTPNLDRLADQGTRFHRFYVTGVTCCPSRTGFLTSRHPASYANYMADYGFQDRSTITELLNKAGYVTGHFGKWHIGDSGAAQDGVYGIDKVQVIGSDKDSPEGRDIRVFRAAMQFMEDNRNKPFYVNVWGHATHYPVNPINTLANKFSNITCKRADFGTHMQSRFDDCEAIGGNIVRSMRNYLGDVYGIDIGVGLLLDKIDDLGLSENTIVVFSSDQGPAPVKTDSASIGDIGRQNMLGYAGGLRGTKHTQYEGGVRSPFIIRWPNRVPAGKVNRNSIFSGLDWLPTLASIAGVSIDKRWYEGEDVSDIWEGASRSRANPLFWRTSKTNAEVSMLQGSWKLHVKNNDVELYDLSSDVKEKKNLASQYPNIVNRLMVKVNEWRSQLPKQYASGSQLNDPVKKPVIVGPANVPDP